MKKIFLFLILLSAFSVDANAQLLVEQGKISEIVDPGSSTSGKLTIHNTTDQGVSVTGYWEDFEYVDPFNGNKKFLPSGAGENSASSLVSFSPKDFNLGPYQKKEVSYTINTPDGAKGGYYGVVFFEKGTPEMDSRLGVRIVSRVGTLFFVESIDQNRTAKFENVAIEGSAFTGSFTNTGNVILIAEGVFYIMDGEGLAVDRGEVKNIYLPEGKTANYRIPFSEDLATGVYSLLLTVDLGEGSSLVKEVDFEKTASGSISIKAIRD